LGTGRVTPSRLYRWAAAAAIAAGLLNLAVEFLPRSIGGMLNLLVNVLGLWILTALYLRQREASGLTGFVGYAGQSFGLALGVGLLFAQVFVLDALEPDLSARLFAGALGLAALAALALITLGAIVFGLATFRAGVFAKGAAVLFMAGFVLTGGTPILPRLAASFGEALVSASLVWLGYELWTMQAGASAIQGNEASGA
jgi:hypothetical protein